MNQAKLDKLFNVLYEHLCDIGESVCEAQSDNFENRCEVCPMSFGAFRDKCNTRQAKQMLFDIQLEVSRQIEEGKIIREFTAIGDFIQKERKND